MVNEQKIFDRIKTLWLESGETEEQKEKCILQGLYEFADFTDIARNYALFDIAEVDLIQYFKEKLNTEINGYGTNKKTEKAEM